MKLDSKTLKLGIIELLNAVCITGAFASCWYLYYSNIVSNSFHFVGDLVIIGIYCILYEYFANLYDGFDVSIKRISDLAYSQIVAFLLSDGLIYIIICIIKKTLTSIVPGLLCIVGQFVIVKIWCIFAHKWYFKNFNPKKTIIIYEKHKDLDSLINEYGLSKKFDVKETKTVKTCLQNLDELKEYETVFMNDVHSKERNILSKYCLENNIEMYIAPRIGDLIMAAAKNSHLFHMPIQKIERSNVNIWYFALKRIFDILFSLIAIIALSPIIILTAIAIKAYDGGPVIYKQKRLTKDEKVFNLYKFRSMKIDAEKETGAVLSTGDNDSRITPIGRIIRKVRLDEIPQFFNILKGDMSIVGPRPERPEIARQYEKKLPEFKLRLQVKAGLTGYAQVYGKYNTIPYNKLKMDLMYIANLNIIEDFRICLATIKILFMKDSTEGISKEKKNAE